MIIMTQNVNIFEMAVKTKMRFPYKGSISVEDLYDLNVKELDSIFKNLNSQLKQIKEESLLEVKTKEDQILDIKIEIVKYIFKCKSEEEQLRLEAKEQKEKEQRLLEVLSKKQDEDLYSKSAEEIMQMIDELKR